MTATNTEFGERMSEYFTSCLPNLSVVPTKHDFTHTLANRPYLPSKLAEILNVLPNPNLDDNAKAIFAMLLAFEHGFEKLSLKASGNEATYNEERSRNVRARNACVTAENEKDVLRAQLETERATLSSTRVELSDSLGKKLAAETQLQLALLQNAQSRATGEGISAQAPTARQTQ